MHGAILVPPVHGPLNLQLTGAAAPAGAVCTLCRGGSMNCSQELYTNRNPQLGILSTPWLRGTCSFDTDGTTRALRMVQARPGAANARALRPWPGEREDYRDSRATLQKTKAIPQQTPPLVFCRLRGGPPCSWFCKPMTSARFPANERAARTLSITAAVLLTLRSA